MKICYLLDFSVLRVDGPTINEYEFIKTLEEQKEVKVAYFTCESNRQLINYKLNETCFFKEYQQKRLIPLFLWSFIAYLRFMSFYFRTRPDIIVTRLGPIPILQFFLSISLGKKLFVKTMGRFWGIEGKKVFKDTIFHKFIIFLNISIMRYARGIDTVTEKFREIFHKKYKINFSKIRVIENAVNAESFCPTSARKRWGQLDFRNFFPILGYVGNLPSFRGAQQLVEVYPYIKKKYPKAAVIIVGDDSGISSIKEKVKNEKLEDYFLLGEVPYEEVPRIVNLFDIGYSFTTQYDLAEVGNSSQKLRQYLACGKPVITMRETNDFVDTEDLGSPVDQNNIEEIAAETLKWIKRIETEGDALSQRLHQYAKEHLSTEKTFQQRLTFWNSLLKDPQQCITLSNNT